MQITSDDLYEFGEWARDHKDDLEPTSAWVLIERDNVARPTNRGYSMTDEKAAKIDKAVCALTNHNAHLAQVFVQHYVLGATYRDLAKHHKCSKATVSNKLAEASGYVVGAASNIVS